MIASFADKETWKIFKSEFSARFSRPLQRIARRKLRMLHFAKHPRDLYAPKSNHLEKLSGRVPNLYSIRVNDQFRITFIWLDNNAHHVQLIDYH